MTTQPAACATAISPKGARHGTARFPPGGRWQVSVALHIGGKCHSTRLQYERTERLSKEFCSNQMTERKRLTGTGATFGWKGWEGQGFKAGKKPLKWTPQAPIIILATFYWQGWTKFGSTNVFQRLFHSTQCNFQPLFQQTEIVFLGRKNLCSSLKTL